MSLISRPRDPVSDGALNPLNRMDIVVSYECEE